MLTWALLVPLFETLLAPITARAAGCGDPPDAQREAWTDIVRSYRN